MLAAVTLIFLSLQILAFGWLGLALAQRFAWPAWSAIPIVVAGVLLLQLLIVLHAFITSGRYSTESEPARRLGWLGRCRLIGGEWMATVLLYSVLQPLNRLINRADAGSQLTGTPVLLIHGLLCNGAAWWWMKRTLARRGIVRCYSIDLEPLFGDIDGYAGQVAGRVEAICAATGARQVFIVAHSMGGLVSRAYLRDHQASRRVAGLLTIGSPHHGTALATIPVGENIRQMQLNDLWLAELADGEALAVPVLSIYTVHDNLVSPQSSCCLPHAENVRLRGVGHVAMLFSEEVAGLVSGFIGRHAAS